MNEDVEGGSTLMCVESNLNEEIKRKTNVQFFTVLLRFCCSAGALPSLKVALDKAKEGLGGETTVESFRVWAILILCIHN